MTKRPVNPTACRLFVRGAICAIAVLSGAPAWAVPAIQTYNVDFASPNQSFWGPGQSAASFGINQLILGNETLGMRFQTGASTGTVNSRYNGAVSVAYDDFVSPGMVPFTIGYQGDPNGAGFQTLLGAFVRVTAYFPVIGGITLTNPNYSISTNSTYTPSPADSRSDSGSFTPASSAIGPDLPGGTARAGIDYDIVQNSTHEVTALKGLAVATNQSTGDTRQADFSLGASDSILLNLDQPGVWDVRLTGLSLDNLFSTDFDLAFVAFAEYALGFGCGDFGTNDDNEFFCVEDGRVDRRLASLDLFSNTPFALALTSSNQLSSFQVTVDAIAQVPEPGTLALLGLAAAGLGFARRRKAA